MMSRPPSPPPPQQQQQQLQRQDIDLDFIFESRTFWRLLTRWASAPSCSKLSFA